MKSLEELQHNWEGFARTDPLWAICNDPEKQNHRWTQEEFFATGQNEVKVVLQCAAELRVSIDWSAPALDFGCGVGRLTQALAAHFPECWGVDIAPSMIKQAQEFAQQIPQCRFLLNQQTTLAELQDNYFGFIYTSIVLQHMAEKYSRGYLAEFLRVLKPGGVLVFQLPDTLRASPVTKLRAKLAFGSKMKSILRTNSGYAMEMHCLKESVARKLMEKSGGRVLDVRLTNSTDPAFCGGLQYLADEPKSGYVSKQYCVVKR
jgi:ubiquinone/menaquinone biosynthesis C-methylase UbiE